MFVIFRNVLETNLVYVAFNSGYVSQSYIDGKEMNMQTSLGAVDSSDDAYFDSAADALYVYSSVT